MTGQKITAAILAGGDSRRIGIPKAFLEMAGKPLVEYIIDGIADLFAEIIIITNDPDAYDFLPYRKAPDVITGDVKSSLRGLHGALRAASHRHCLVIPCDMPFINRGLIKKMASYIGDYQVVAPFTGGHYQPLHAFYQQSCLPLIENQLMAGNHKITTLFDQLAVKCINEEEIKEYGTPAHIFFNINNPADYYQARRKVRPRPAE